MQLGWFDAREAKHFGVSLAETLAKNLATRRENTNLRRFRRSIQAPISSGVQHKEEATVMPK
jgi:hypothetical protein